MEPTTPQILKAKYDGVRKSHYAVMMHEGTAQPSTFIGVYQSEKDANTMCEQPRDEVGHRVIGNNSIKDLRRKDTFDSVDEHLAGDEYSLNDEKDTRMTFSVTRTFVWSALIDPNWEAVLTQSVAAKTARLTTNVKAKESVVNQEAESSVAPGGKAREADT